MNLKNLINKSWYGSIGYINNDSDIELLGSYLLHNQLVLDEFEGHIFAFTYNELNEEYLENTISSLYPDAIIIYLDKNRGHNFGTADLDNTVFDICKDLKVEWLCKASNDIILQPEVLGLPIQEADFYYMNGIGYGGMVKYNFNNERIINEDFFPQTNFYFINVSKTDYLNNKEYIDKTYNEIQNIPNYNGKIWEYFQGWECEGFLRECVNRNNLSKYHLIPQKTYIKLLELIKQQQIHDCSHKNVMIEGICHYQNINQNITIIN
jgi:hypothetical protein